MAFKRLDSVVNGIVRRMGTGDTGAAGTVPASRGKNGKVARPKPGQVNREVTPPAHTKDASRYGRMDGFPPPGGRAPVHSMRQYLIVIEGGRQTHSGGAWEGPAGHNALAGGSARRVLLKLVAN